MDNVEELYIIKKSDFETETEEYMVLRVSNTYGK